MMNEQALKDKIKFIAKERKTRFNICWKQVMMERFLCRLSRSASREHLVFKGGFLLSYMLDIKRETVDLDFLLWKFKAGKEPIQTLCHNITEIDCKDGFTFSLDQIALLPHLHMAYKGYQISFCVSFGNMKDKLHIDIGIGDFVRPQNRKLNMIQYRGKPLFDDDLSLWTYPIESILAEKLEAILSRGATNSRIKDYHDVYLLMGIRAILDPVHLKESIQKTFEKRKTSIKAIWFNEMQTSTLQKLWKAHLTSMGTGAAELALPDEIQAVIDLINDLIGKDLTKL